MEDAQSAEIGATREDGDAGNAADLPERSGARKDVEARQDVPAMSDDLPAAPRDITRLLAALSSGDRGALDQLFELVYAELQRLARAQLRRLPAEATLSTTALVHEVYVRFAGAERLAAGDRQHFYSLSARAMRQILVDHAKRRLALRRGGDRQIVPLSDRDHASGWDHPGEVDLARVLAIDNALSRLEQLDERLARVVEWRVFAGLTFEEIAAAGEASVSTLKRDWRKARAFLERELSAARSATAG
jgi:RNA polymerase sigma factor (TIGR02999 family)